MSEIPLYEARLEQLGSISLKADTVAEARSALKTLRTRQKELRALKREINDEVKAIRASAKAAIAEAGQKQHLLMGAVFGRKSAGGMRAAAKRDIASARDHQIKPYEHLKARIDKIILQIDAAKLEIERELEAQKPEPTSSSTQRSKDPSPMDDLERLAALRNAGALTDDEFKAQKSKILSRL